MRDRRECRTDLRRQREAEKLVDWIGLVTVVSLYALLVYAVIKVVLLGG